MLKYSSHDKYIDSISGVLKNRLGITHQNKLEEVEASLTAWRSYQLSIKPLAGNFDFAHLKSLHRYLFGDIYEWAGQTRTIDISRGSTRFANANHIEKSAQAIFNKLKSDNFLVDLAENEFSERIAYYFGEINALHPFREGNGRTQRELINHIAYRNGFYIEWQYMTQAEMIKASIESFNGDCSRIANYIKQYIGK